VLSVPDAAPDREVVAHEAPRRVFDDEAREERGLGFADMLVKQMENNAGQTFQADPAGAVGAGKSGAFFVNVLRSRARIPT